MSYDRFSKCYRDFTARRQVASRVGHEAGRIGVGMAPSAPIEDTAMSICEYCAISATAALRFPHLFPSWNWTRACKTCSIGLR